MKQPSKLTVIIRDDSPFRHMQASPSYRVVEVALTEEQRQKLSLFVTDSTGSPRSQGFQEFHEEISQAIIE